MSIHSSQFLGLDGDFAALDTAAAVILPFPYEGGISAWGGTGQAPDAVLAASRHVELYDERLQSEPYRMGIATVAPLAVSGGPEEVQQRLRDRARELLDMGKFVAVVGGDHSISSAYCQALHDKFGTISAIQLDAHADLRAEYEGDPLSHACVMSRIREITNHTLQIGIRSMSSEEALRIEGEDIPLVTMESFRGGKADIEGELRRLPDPVFLTFDVDVLDWSVVRSTGTPEPGGMLWGETIELLDLIFRSCRVVGFDVVELGACTDDPNSPFAVARLVYRMLGLKLSRYLSDRDQPWPQTPAGLSIH